jgi:nicotinamide phosphoribosyltransferase
MKKLDKVFRINPLYEADGYKIAHKNMLAPNTTREYWTWIARSLKYMHPSITKIMSAGQQLVWRYIHSNFQELFFDQHYDVAEKFGKDMAEYLMMDYDAEHFKQLHKLGFLPIHIQALPEGTFTNPNIPHSAGINTVDGYAWLGLYLETLVSKLSWQLPTAATIGAKFKENAVEWVLKTDKENLWLADYMCHDFHSRGGNPFTSIVIGLAHAFSHKGSDTLNVIPASRYYYDVKEDEVCINSVSASEHSVTCTGIFYYEGLLKAGKLDESIFEYYSFDAPCEGTVATPDYLAIAEWLNLRDWLKKFPRGILSVVSDTFDLWKLITFILPRLKTEILAREGKLVIRPDSGDPVNITCGEGSLYEDISQYFPEGEVFPEYFEDYLLEEVREETDHGERGVDEYSQIYSVRGVLYEATIHNISWNRYDKQYYFIDMWEKAKITLNKIKIQPKDKGVIELLWDIFGGTVNEQGYKVLDSHIGAIYGDSINLERQVNIYSRLAEKGFAATNIVLGVGSFTYVYITRDQAGYAAKGAWFEILNEDGIRKEFNIYKDPITDDGTKKSLKGFQFVYLDEEGEYQVEGEVSEEKAFSDENKLKSIYIDGKFLNQVTLTQIREKLNG